MSLQISLDKFRWGTDPVPGAEHARRVNLLDEQSGMIITFVFGDEPLESFIKELAEGLTDEQRMSLGASLLGGRMGDQSLTLTPTESTFDDFGPRTVEGT